MQIANRLSKPFLFTGAAALLFAPVLTAQAQEPIQASASVAAPSNSLFALDTGNVAGASFNMAKSAGISYEASFSSSSSIDAVEAERLNLEGAATDALQPPPRRRYGRPRYNDSSHNADGSSKYAFIAGAGLTLPNGNTYHYLNTDYAFQVGAGRNFNKNFSLIAQFDWDNFGFNGRTLAQQEALYNYYCPAASANAGLCTQFTQLDGKSHLWSLSLNPVYNIYSREGLGAYVVGGVGFYHKTANFTTPVEGIGVIPGYGYYTYTADATVDKYTSNAPGFNGGFGLTYKPSRFSSQRLYVEARYVFVDNSQRSGVTISSPTATLNAYTGSNFYPHNSNRTTYVPIKAGIRF